MNYIYTIYQEKSFSKAAQKLFLTQPALSAVVKKVEKEIGQQIFDRSTIPLSLTEAGAYYIESVQKILSIYDNMSDYFSDLSNVKTGRLSIGSSSFYCTHILPSRIGEFKKKYPNVEVNLYESSVEILKQRVNQGELDIILETAIFNSDPLEKYLIEYEDILLGVPAGFAVNQRLRACRMTFQDVCQKIYLEPDFPGVSLAAFQGEPFLFLREGNDLYARGREMCRKAGFDPHITIYLDQILTSFKIACTGVGIVFLRNTMFPHLNETDRLVYYKLNSPLARRPVYYAYKKGRYVSKAMAAFFQMNNISL